MRNNDSRSVLRDAPLAQIIGDILYVLNSKTYNLIRQYYSKISNAEVNVLYHDQMPMHRQELWNMRDVFSQMFEDNVSDYDIIFERVYGEDSNEAYMYHIFIKLTDMSEAMFRDFRSRPKDSRLTELLAGKTYIASRNRLL